jgi:hypothetical protein
LQLTSEAAAAAATLTTATKQCAYVAIILPFFAKSIKTFQGQWVSIAPHTYSEFLFGSHNVLSARPVDAAFFIWSCRKKQEKRKAAQKTFFLLLFNAFLTSSYAILRAALEQFSSR